LVKDIKISSSLYIKSKNIFPHFDAWQEGRRFKLQMRKLQNKIIKNCLRAIKI